MSIDHIINDICNSMIGEVILIGDNTTMDPAFCSMSSHLMTWLTFYLFDEKYNFFFLKNLESPLIFVLFLKRKQNKKENFKCNSLFGKPGMWKIESSPGVRLLIGKVQ